MLRRLGHLWGRRRPRWRRGRWRRLGLCQLNLLFHRRLGFWLWLWLRFWLGFRLRLWFRRQGLFLDLVREDQFLFLLRRFRRWCYGRRRWRRSDGGRRRCWRRRWWRRRLWLLRRCFVRVTFFRDNAPDRSEDLLHRRFLGRFGVVHNLVPGGATPGVQTSIAPSTGPSSPIGRNPCNPSYFGRVSQGMG